MKIRHITVLLFAAVVVSGVWGQSPSKPTSDAAAVVKCADGFRFTEGPAADAAGHVYFTDIPNNRIHRWSVDGTLSVFVENSGGANGLYVDTKGHLLACAGGAGRLVSIDPKGVVTVLADRFNGQPFNSPNDLWLDPAGGIYFTDPRYGNREALPQDGEHVYYLSADRKRLIRVIDDMVRPNGLIGTPDGKRLYVADHGASKTYAYTIGADGSLSEKTLFAEQGSDGMTLDAAGNLYLTAAAVDVYNPAGQMIRSIAVPERPSNVCFGGAGKNKLFITARTAVYSLDMPSTLYSFTMKDIDANAVPLSRYAGSVLLIVNVASRCGFTKQYAGLQELYETYRQRGLVVLGFPANNFMRQEPGTDAQIKDFCTTQFQVTFPMFSKISVKGKQIHPLYQYLTGSEKGQKVSWNFNKFLIDRDGNTVAHFGSKVKPADANLIAAIEKALGENE